ncbi:hypothetical protein, partial [Escherichia coli]|uniref:hypothetical protein n=1 Tax=Escherichia coli TaxID=562 RepID=UPI00196776F1
FEVELPRTLQQIQLETLYVFLIANASHAPDSLLLSFENPMELVVSIHHPLDANITTATPNKKNVIRKSNT